MLAAQLRFYVCPNGAVRQLIDLRPWKGRFAQIEADTISVATDSLGP